MSNISIQQLGIRLGNNAIISDLNLEVRAGEFLVLLGPSGCGKSTLLHSIAGFIEPETGSLHIGGQDMTWADPKDRGIGMVFQSYALYPTMTVEQNMSFGPRIAGLPKAQITERVQRAATMLHLTELLKRKPAELSGGQRQRVAIGRALVRDAKVLLFDEPLSNLDAKLRASLRRELKELHAQLGATMVYVTHDQVEAMTLADRIAVMKAGVIQQIDSPALVYGKPANMYVAGFLGSPPMNFVQGRLRREPDALHFESKDLSLDISAYGLSKPVQDGQAVVMGIRPEDIGLSREPLPGAVQGQLRLVEPMGASQVLWVGVQDLDLGVIAESSLQTSDAMPLWLRLDPSRASLFDAASEQRL